MDIAKGVGAPLKIDNMMINGDLGHFARILGDVDLASEILKTLMLEKTGESFFVDVIYEKLPDVILVTV